MPPIARVDYVPLKHLSKKEQDYILHNAITNLGKDGTTLFESFFYTKNHQTNSYDRISKYKITAKNIHDDLFLRHIAYSTFLSVKSEDIFVKRSTLDQNIQLFRLRQPEMLNAFCRYLLYVTITCVSCILYGISMTFYFQTKKLHQLMLNLIFVMIGVQFVNCIVFMVLRHKRDITSLKYFYVWQLLCLLVSIVWINHAPWTTRSAILILIVLLIILVLNGFNVFFGMMTIPFP